MQKQIGTAVCLGIAAALLSGMTANAGDKPKGERQRLSSEEMFAKMDADGDGSVTKAEFEAAHAARMQKYAERKGGDAAVKVDPAASAERMNKRFTAMDKDGNGSLSKEEYLAAPHWRGAEARRKHGNKPADEAAPEAAGGDEGEQAEE